MRLVNLIRSSLLASLPACGWDTGSNCGEPESDTSPFSVDLEVFEADWAEMQTRADDGSVDSCAELCEIAAPYPGFYDGSVRSFEVESCSVTEGLLGTEPVTDTGDTGDTGLGASLGRITCEGTVTISEICLGGRRPAGARVRPGRGPSAAGRALAALADMEAASILAFEELASWLEAEGTPPELIARCREAAEDERRHARMIGALARRAGGQRGGVSRQPAPAGLLAVAIHNAVEGCVHESWAALEAAWQARCADPSLRPAFARIADDELRHGQLAWDLHAWLWGRLGESGRAAVASAQRAALTRLPELVSVDGDGIGRPSGVQGRALAARFAAGLAAG